MQGIADAIDFYGFKVRDKDIVAIPDTDLGSGNPTKFRAFPLAVEAMIDSLNMDSLYRYPYTEGSDDIRQQLLNYVEREGFITRSALMVNNP